MHPIIAVAGKEFRDDLRNRWVLALTILFAVLALGLAYFGSATVGRLGFQSFNATLSSLTTLAAFVVPLIGLLIAYDTVVGERDKGTLLLLLSYPVSRGELLIGKFLGHSTVLLVATLVGFGIAVGVIQALTPAARSLAAWIDIAGFIGSSALLGACFAGAAAVVSVLTRDKSRAAGLALLAWFVLVILFDLLLLALLVASGGNGLEQAVYPYLMLCNPIDVFRLVNLTALGGGSGNEVFLGMTAAHHYSLPLLYGTLIAWTLAPFGLALFLFRRQEL